MLLTLLAFALSVETQSSNFLSILTKAIVPHEQMLILISQTDAHKQTVLADRATNPNVQEICRLFNEW